MVDFGDDRLTQGRPHPMIDGSLRVDRLLAEVDDPATGVVLLDVVLGLGAADDPAAELAPALIRARDAGVPVVAVRHRHPRRPAGTAGPGGARSTTPAPGCSCPTRRPPGARSTCSPGPRHEPDHPPGRRHRRRLAARRRADPAGRRGLRRPVAPPSGDPASLAAVMGDPRRVAANAEALRRMLAAEAHLVDVLPASEALGLGRGEFLHAGPPVDWERASGPMRGALIGAMLFEGLAALARGGDPAAGGRRRRDLGALPLARRGRADGRRHHPVDVGVLPPRRDDRQRVVVLAQRGARQGAEVRRVRRRGGRAAALDDRRARPAAAARRADRRTDRREGDHRADGADGRRGPQPQPGRDADVPARGAARDDRLRLREGRRRGRGEVRVRQRPLLPEPRDAGLQAHHRRRRRHPGLDGGHRDGPQRHRLRHPDVGHRRHAGSRRRRTRPRGCTSAPSGPTTPTPTSATRRSPRRPASAAWRWPRRPRSCGSWAGRCRTRWPPRSGCTTSRVGENPAYGIPILEFRGTPTGIDVTAVTRSGVLPQINTGMAGRVAGTGQVGAGLVTPPMACFTQALDALAASVDPGVSTVDPGPGHATRRLSRPRAVLPSARVTRLEALPSPNGGMLP